MSAVENQCYRHTHTHTRAHFPADTQMWLCTQSAWVTHVWISGKMEFECEVRRFKAQQGLLQADGGWMWSHIHLVLKSKNTFTIVGIWHFKYMQILYFYDFPGSYRISLEFSQHLIQNICKLFKVSSCWAIQSTYGVFLMGNRHTVGCIVSTLLYPWHLTYLYSFGIKCYGCQCVLIQQHMFVFVKVWIQLH